MKKTMLLTTVLMAISGIALGTTYITLPSGYIHRAFVDYVDSDTIKIHAGFGECNGHYWEITSPLEHDMTGLTTTQDYHYIYIDDANSVYPDPTIIDRTTEPAWNDSKMGWYNSNDRCVGVVISKDGSAQLLSFVGNSDGKIIITDSTNLYLLQNGEPDGDKFLECSTKMPVNVKMVLLHASNSNWTGVVTLRVWLADTGYREEMLAQAYQSSASAHNWLVCPHNWSRDLYWNAPSYCENDFTIRLQGWDIER